MLHLDPGPRLNIKTVVPDMVVSIKRRSWDRFFFIMEIHMAKRHRYIETPPLAFIEILFCELIDPEWAGYTVYILFHQQIWLLKSTTMFFFDDRRPFHFLM